MNLDRWCAYAAVDANSSVLLAFVSKFIVRANAMVKTQISPSLTLLFVTRYKAMTAPISSNAAITMLNAATALLILRREKMAIDSST